MTTYFFNLCNGTGFTEDDEGRELPDLGAARREAVSGIRSIIAEEVLKGRLDLDGRIDILDETGALLLTVTFAEAFDVRPAWAAAEAAGSALQR